MRAIRLLERVIFICIAFLLALSASAQTTAATAGLGSIRGTVVSVTGEPLRKAEVVLRSMGQRGGASRGVPMRMDSAGWAHTTDPSGTFAFQQLPPGTYSLAVQRTGYVGTERAGGPGPASRNAATTITLGPGQDVAGVTIKLAPHSVITGKVTDEDGDPVPFASVQVLRERWIQGKRQIVPMNAGSTNDLGEYRIAGLVPGRYHLMVTHNRSDNLRRRRPEGAQSDLGYVPVYYPGTFEFSQAAPVTVEPGQELRGMDFQMRQVATFRLRGNIVDANGAPANRVGVIAMPADGVVMGRARNIGMASNGVFEIAGLQPGNYTLVANSGGRGQARTFARQTIQIGGRDADGVLLAMQPTFEVSGTIRAPEGVSLAGSRVFLDPVETGMPFGGGGSGQVEGNAWKIEGVGPGRFRVFLNPVPEGTYVRGVSVQGQDITSGAMITGAAAGVEITLGSGAPTFNGTVVNKDKAPASGVTVVLVPEQSRQERFWLYRTAITDQQGAFALKNLTPGQYTVYAFADAEDGAWHSPDFLKLYDGDGLKITLEEKAQETAALTVAER